MFDRRVRPADRRRRLRSRLVRLAVVAALLAIPLADNAPFASAGRTYYVSTKGSDRAPGTLARPLRTIAKAISRLRPGDSLFVRGGIYRETITQAKIRPARRGARILVAAYGTEDPVIQGVLWLRNPSYWVVDNIDVTGSERGGGRALVQVTGGASWTIRDAEIWRGRTIAGVRVLGKARSFRLSNLVVHDLVAAQAGGAADLVRIDSAARGTVERSLLVASPDGRGVRIGNTATTTTSIAVRYNTFYGNRGPSNVQLHGKVAGVRVTRNIMVWSSDGVPSVTGSDLRGRDNIVAANLVWRSAGVVQHDAAGLVDHGGNLTVDPRFANPAGGDFRPLEPLATEYGRHGRPKRGAPPAPSPSPEPAPSPSPSDPPSPSPSPSSSPSPAPDPGPAGRLYAATSFWNTPIPSGAALDPGSAAIVQAALVAYGSNANFANTDAWGIAIVEARSTDKTYTVGCTRFDCGTSVQFRIPAGAKPTTASDAHLVVIDGTKELDMWRASYDAGSDSWSAGSRYLTAADGWGAICSLGSRCNGAVAAGFAAFGGIPRPEEFAGDVIPHALTITTPYTRSGFIACPATHTDGKYADGAALPEGARIQLDPSFPVDGQSWPRWKKVIARTLQVYGAYVSDTGGTLAIRGESDVNRPGAWAAAGIPEGAGLSDLPWSSFRVLKLEAC